MSDEEHHFESKADAGASKTYPQQAGNIRKSGYIVIKNRPCKVVEDGFGKGKELVVTVMSSMREEQICAFKDIGPNNSVPCFMQGMAKDDSR
ncbi:hypothetical protein OIU78_003908 [Salix suchowensis]|nr:hypothetical protein OIU78_003908 [Salix suchowensis]